MTAPETPYCREMCCATDAKGSKTRAAELLTNVILKVARWLGMRVGQPQCERRKHLYWGVIHEWRTHWNIRKTSQDCWIEVSGWVHTFEDPQTSRPEYFIAQLVRLRFNIMLSNSYGYHFYIPKVHRFDSHSKAHDLSHVTWLPTKTHPSFYHGRL